MDRRPYAPFAANEVKKTFSVTSVSSVVNVGFEILPLRSG